MRILVFVMGVLFSATSLAQTPRVVLKGYDPVAYFTESKARKGSTDISYEFDEARYLFASGQNRETFTRDPDKYTPQFAGFCTAGIAHGMKAEANPEVFLIVNGKLYTFSSVEARNMAQADPTMFAQAEKKWREKK